MSEIRERLLDAAAEMIQRRGFHDVSFRDLGAAVGITSASIHYHFPTKAVLGIAVVERYSNAFMARLGAPDEGDPGARLAHYAGIFRETLQADRHCLCGIIGAEIGGIPPEIGDAVRKFFARNVEWLAEVLVRTGLGKKTAAARAELILATLEGALLVARTSHDPAVFDRVTQGLLATVEGP